MCINMLLRPETGHSVKEHMLLEKGNKLIPKFPVVKLHADQLIVLKRKSGDSDSEWCVFLWRNWSHDVQHVGNRNVGACAVVVRGHPGRWHHEGSHQGRPEAVAHGMDETMDEDGSVEKRCVWISQGNTLVGLSHTTVGQHVRRERIKISQGDHLRCDGWILYYLQVPTCAIVWCQQRGRSHPRCSGIGHLPNAGEVERSCSSSRR